MTPPMRRATLVPLALMALVAVATSQTYDPSFTLGSCSPYHSTGTTLFDGLSSPADDAFQDIPIGFTFMYYGVPHTTLRVSTNGYVTFPPASGTVHFNSFFPDS